MINACAPVRAAKPGAIHGCVTALHTVRAPKLVTMRSLDLR
jgi:hypothetical protein